MQSIVGPARRITPCRERPLNIAAPQHAPSTVRADWPEVLFNAFWAGIFLSAVVVVGWPAVEISHTKRLLRDDGVAESWFGHKTHLLQTSEFKVIAPLYVIAAGGIAGVTFGWYRVRGCTANAPIVMLTCLLAVVGTIWALQTHARFKDAVAREFRRARNEVRDFENLKEKEKETSSPRTVTPDVSE